MQELRDRLAERDRQLMAADLIIQNNSQTATIINSLKPPCPIPAYLTCSPFESYPHGCGCGCGQ